MEVMGKLWNVVYGLRPILMMILIQITVAVMVIMYKLASEDGMPMKILTCYRYMLALATIAPVAFFIERKRRPKLTWMVVMQAFTIALLGSTMAQNLYAESLTLTSATLATALINLVPAITFLMAIFFRVEKLGLNSMAGKAKMAGTLISISGAMVLTLYKGVEIKILSTSIDLLHKNDQHGHVGATHHQHIHRPYLGSLLVVASCFFTAFGLILTTKISVRYPCHYSCTGLICMFGALQTLAIALLFEKDWSQWKLGWDVRLLTSLFAGMSSGLLGPISLWCVRVRGPVFVSVFNPLLIVLVAIGSSLFLKELLHLGSVLGAAIIMCGLYLVIWGKSKEMKRKNQLIPSKSIEACNLTTAAKVDDTTSIIPINPLGVLPNLLPPIILSNDDTDENNKEVSCEIESVGRRSEEP